MSTKRAQELRQSMTAAEIRIWARLRRLRARGYHFRRQSQIGRFIVDFEHRKSKVAIELDGGQHREQAEYDEARTRWLEHRGYIVLRFWNGDALRETDAVIHVIQVTVDQRLMALEHAAKSAGVTPSP